MQGGNSLMARFEMELPKDIMDDFKKLYNESDKIFGEMTKAGAEVALNNVKSTVPIRELSSHVALSKTYKTPSDDGINTKVYFKGYIPFSGNRTEFVRKGGGGKKSYSSTKGVPAAFVAQVTEYGTSERYTDAGSNRGQITKKPFFRKAFKKSQIEKAMLAAQKKASGGLLDE